MATPERELTDRLNAIRERAEAAYRFPASTSKQAASADDVLPLLEAVEYVIEWAEYAKDTNDALDPDMTLAGIMHVLGGGGDGSASAF